MKKYAKLIPLAIASVLVLGACGKDDKKADEQEEVIILSEDEMDEDDAFAVKANSTKVFNLVAVILHAHPQSVLEEYKFESQLKKDSKEDSREDRIGVMIGKVLYNDSSMDEVVSFLTKGHKKTYDKYHKGWTMEYSVIRDAETELYQSGESYFISMPLEAKFVNDKTNKVEYVLHEARLVLKRDEQKILRVVYMEIEEGTSDMGKGVLNSQGIQSYSKEAFEFGVLNAMGLKYEDDNDLIEAFKSYTDDKEVMAEFIKNFELNRAAEDVEFAYSNIKTSSKTITETKGNENNEYTDKLTMSGDVEITYTEGEKEVSNTYEIEVTMQNLAVEGYSSYYFNLTGLKIKKIK